MDGPQTALLTGLQGRSTFLEMAENLYVFILFKKLIYLFLAALGLCCCAWAFSSCGERGLLFVAVHEL